MSEKEPLIIRGERVAKMSQRIEQYMFNIFPDDPIEEVCVALLTTAAMIAKSQRMKEFEFRRMCRDMYRTATYEGKKP